VERLLLGFQRTDDLPAHLVPEAWFAFVRHGTTHKLPALLAHNRWDLLSLVALLPRWLRHLPLQELLALMWLP
jgi:uncharacterized protein